MSDPDREKLEELSARIHAAEKKPEETPAASSSGPLKASQTGYEFAGTVIGCTLVGWLIDRYLHTRPWGMVGMVLIGFVAGMMNIWRALNASGRQAEDKKE